MNGRRVLGKSVFPRARPHDRRDHVAGGRNYRVRFLLVNPPFSGSERPPSSKLWRRFAVGVWRLRRARELATIMVRRRRTWSDLRRPVSRSLMN